MVSREWEEPYRIGAEATGSYRYVQEGEMVSRSFKPSDYRMLPVASGCMWDLPAASVTASPRACIMWCIWDSASGGVPSHLGAAQSIWMPIGSGQQ